MSDAPWSPKGMTGGRPPQRRTDPRPPGARLIARVLHDLVAHPLIAFTGGVRWAHRFHDWIGVVWAAPDMTRAVVIRAEHPQVERAVEVLHAAGYEVVDVMHDVAHLVAPVPESES